ncbi:kinase-like domain-containing protein [Scleroderma citrinum]
MALSPPSVLLELSQRATRYSINLNDWVDRDMTERPLRGCNAFVYQGTLRPEGLKVAVKTIRSGPPGDPEAIARILREVHVWSKLRHENIVPLLGITTQFDHTVSIISEWMGTGNAHIHVQNRDVDPRPLIVEIARGLNYLHNHPSGPVYHGDLKGYNVLVSRDGHALLTDFGMSYLVKSSFSIPVSVPCGGTINWISPENLDDFKISSEGDIWAFGMTALHLPQELFTRAVPYYGIETLAGVMRRILHGPPDRPTDEQTCSRMSIHWWNICYSCWNRDPSSRPSIMEIINKFEEKMISAFFALPTEREEMAFRLLVVLQKVR